MKKEQKTQVLEQIAAQLAQTPDFYLTDISGLNAEQTVALRRACFEKGIKLSVVKNTLLGHVLETSGNDDLKEMVGCLKGNTAVMYTSVVNAPAKLIKDFTKKNNLEKPALKAAYVQGCTFIGADKLGALIAVKSKEELLGDVIAALQSPIRNVISALQNGGEKTVAGLVKTLSEKEEK